jgi:hypothetical protein
MTEVYVVSDAWKDVFLAYEWYDSRSPGLGAEFMQVIHFALDSIQENPLQFPIVEGTIRRARTKRFPYGVFFTLEHGMAVVFAMEDLRRSPSRWRRRRK